MVTGPLRLGGNRGLVSRHRTAAAGGMLRSSGAELARLAGECRAGRCRRDSFGGKFTPTESGKAAAVPIATTGTKPQETWRKLLGIVDSRGRVVKVAGTNYRVGCESENNLAAETQRRGEDRNKSIHRGGRRGHMRKAKTKEC